MPNNKKCKTVDGKKVCKKLASPSLSKKTSRGIQPSGRRTKTSRGIQP